MKLLPDFKTKWLAALRSGAFIQGKGALIQSHGGGQNAYCCLGVACVLLDLDPSNEQGGTLTSDPADFIDLAWGTTSDPSAAKKEQEKLADMNDTHYTFDEIADYIEQHL